MTCNPLLLTSALTIFVQQRADIHVFYSWYVPFVSEVDAGNAVIYIPLNRRTRPGSCSLAAILKRIAIRGCLTVHRWQHQKAARRPF